MKNNPGILKTIRQDIGLYLFIFVLVFLKKWEAGGHIDATWYSTIAKNIASSDDYFRFSINPFFQQEVFDHFPLSYWIMGTLMKLFGATDLVARSYFMLSSFVAYLLVFKIGALIKDKAFGYCAVVTLALCLFYGKWSGGIKHDVPLTAAYLGFIYFFLRGLKLPKMFYYCALFFAWGIFSKGPVMMGAPLGLGIWILLTRKFGIFKEKHFWGALGLHFAFLAIPFIPALHFQGKNYYAFYLEKKRNYLQLAESDPEYFFYFTSLVKNQVHIFVAFLASVFLFIKTPLVNEREGRQSLLLCVIMVLSILVPFSFFQVKLGYYAIPAYPFYALFSAQALYWIWNRYHWDWSRSLTVLSVFIMMLMLTFPIKTTGGRPKSNLNIINVIKFDRDISTKPVAFLGNYDTDMSIFQEYKFYGNIDLRPKEDSEVEAFINEGKGYLVVPLARMPLTAGGKTYESEHCFMLNDLYCLLSLEGTPQLRPSVRQWPHEVYP